MANILVIEDEADENLCFGALFRDGPSVRMCIEMILKPKAGVAPAQAKEKA